MNQYLIAANTKRGQLIFNIFRRVDLIIISSGTVATFLLFLFIQPDNLIEGVITLFPIAVCGFLVLPIANYQNVLCIIQNIYNYYFVDKNELTWKGWCAKDEYK